MDTLIWYWIASFVDENQIWQSKKDLLNLLTAKILVLRWVCMTSLDSTLYYSRWWYLLIVAALSQLIGNVEVVLLQRQRKEKHLSSGFKLSFIITLFSLRNTYTFRYIYLERYGTSTFHLIKFYVLIIWGMKFESVGKVNLEDGEYYDYDDDANESISVTQIRNSCFCLSDLFVCCLVFRPSNSDHPLACRWYMFILEIV